jgi:hypothetical protein
VQAVAVDVTKELLVVVDVIMVVVQDLAWVEILAYGLS